MATALERTIIGLLILLGVEVIVIGNIISGGHDAFAASEEPADVMAMQVSDVAYKPPIGIGITSKKATAKTKGVAEDSKSVVELEEVAAEPEGNATYELEETVVEPEVDIEPDWQAYQEAVIESEVDTEAEWQEPEYEGDGGCVDANVDGAWISGSDLMFNGVHYDNGSGYSYTYYSENVLPGGGLDIPGRHTNDEGYVCDGDGNICIASDDLAKGTVVNVPFGDGTAVVYDCGSGYGNLDVYVSW